MAYEIFTEGWAKACQEAINRNGVYKIAARDWVWPLVLVMERGEGLPEARAVYLDLYRGVCRGTRIATPAERRTAPYVICATPENWQRVLRGQLDPILALLRGKLKLERGNLVKLARYGNAAKQLVLSAAQVESTFPGSALQPERQPAPLPLGERKRETPVFVTTSPQGLRHDLLPMKLYHKAKRLGIWNPQDIDFTKDKRDWQKMNALEREVILHLTSLFQAGEESVTRDLLPLLLVMADEGRLEEEMYLTTFLWEEAKHTEFFRRFLDEVAAEHGDLSRFHGENYHKIFYEALPAAMNALRHDPSPAAQIRAVVTYNMVVEGILAETGYHAYHAALVRSDLLPGIRAGITYLKRDESRHIAYGIYLLSRLIHAHPALWGEVEAQMAALLQVAVNVINEIFDAYPEMPFGLQPEDFIDYAMSQFNHRMERLEQARHRLPGHPEPDEPQY